MKSHDTGCRCHKCITLAAMAMPSPPAPCSECKREQERWLRRFTGHFGEPTHLQDFRDGKITFRELYSLSMRFAEMVVAEAQYIQAVAFDDVAPKVNKRSDLLMKGSK